MSKVSQQIVGVKDVAEILMITTRRVSQLVDDGTLRKCEKRGEYRLFDVVQDFIKFVAGEKRNHTKVVAENKVRDARTREIELRIAERERRLIDVNEAFDALDEIIGLLRTELSGLAPRVTREQSLRLQIENEIDEILKRASDACQEKARNIREGIEDTNALEENDT